MKPKLEPMHGRRRIQEKMTKSQISPPVWWKAKWKEKKEKQNMKKSTFLLRKLSTHQRGP